MPFGRDLSINHGRQKRDPDSTADPHSQFHHRSLFGTGACGIAALGPVASAHDASYACFQQRFFFLHAGFNINTILGETHGEDFGRFVQLGGYRIIRDFQRESPDDFIGVSSADWPYLAMLRKGWLKPAANNPLSELFTSPRPRLGFSTAQQRLLEYALMEETDSSIATLLGVSFDRVKKVWLEIHEKTLREMPFLVPNHGGGRAGVRGPSRRRQLLDYVRLHMEELRPFDPVSSNQKPDRG
jgi:hypothetical protein